MYIRNEVEARRVNKVLRLPGAKDALGPDLYKRFRKDTRNAIAINRERNAFIRQFTHKELAVLVVIDDAYTLVEFVMPGRPVRYRYFIGNKDSAPAPARLIRSMMNNGYLKKSIQTWKYAPGVNQILISFPLLERGFLHDYVRACRADNS